MAKAAVLTVVLVGSAQAQQAYPTRPVTLTHGFAAGGNGDVVSRIVGDALSKHLGQPVVIEPRPGAGGNTASQRLATSPPDGYTLISLTSAHAVSAAIYTHLPFDPLDSFQFISSYGYQALLIAVRKDSPIKTMADLIAAAKADPGKLTYSSVGVGSTQHLAGELLCAMAGIKMTHVPYRGGGGPMTDLLGGQIDLNVDTITVIEPQLRAGKVTVLGVTSGQKWWSLPDITPIAATVPGYDVQTWVGMAAPKGTPADIVKKINAGTRAGLADKETVERLNKIGLDVHTSTPEDMRTLVADQIVKWKKVVADAHIPQQ
jgi:tripartite-type tricarboxylate transporter receptor subunit TctC